MNNKTKKLTLSRETLLPLVNGELADVQGGATPVAASAAVTLRVCVPASRATCGQAAKWVTKNVCVPASIAVATKRWC